MQEIEICRKYCNFSRSFLSEVADGQCHGQSKARDLDDAGEGGV